MCFLWKGVEVCDVNFNDVRKSGSRQAISDKKQLNMLASVNNFYRMTLTCFQESSDECACSSSDPQLVSATHSLQSSVSFPTATATKCPFLYVEKQEVEDNEYSQSIGSARKRQDGEGS